MAEVGKVGQKLWRAPQAELQLLVKKTLPVAHLLCLQMQYQSASAAFSSRNCRASWGAEAEFARALCKSPAALATAAAADGAGGPASCSGAAVLAVKLPWCSGSVCAALSKLL